MGKRQLGLSQAKKRQKKNEGESVQEDAPAATNLTIELPASVNDDEFTQLKSLYSKYKQDKNELILNGVIHECDRLIRNVKDIPAFFYVIYSNSLLELINYLEEKEINEVIDLSIEKVDLGLEAYKDDIELLFQKSKVLLNQVMVKLGELKEGKSDYALQEHLTQGLKLYLSAQDKSFETKNYSYFTSDTFEVIKLFDEILEVVDNFGKNLDDSEDEDEAEEQETDDNETPQEIKAIRDTEEYDAWWRDNAIKFHEALVKKGETEGDLLRTVCLNIGQSYLKEAEEPANIFTTLMYDEVEETTINGLDVKTAQDIGIDLFNKAIPYLRKSWNDEDVQSWVNLSELLISLGNLYELDSKQQIECYEEAEKILRKANNVTNGKYKDILDNLLGESED